MTWISEVNEGKLIAGLAGFQDRIDPMVDSTLLEEAADLMEKRGWTQGTMEDYGGQVCLLGACKRASEKLGRPTRYNSFARALGFEAPSSATLWNDYTASDEQEVLDLLREKAKALRIKEEG